MPTIRFVLTGPSDSTDHLLTTLESVEGVTRVEELGPSLPHMDDADSSSAGLASDGGTKASIIEIDVPDADVAYRATTASRAAARSIGAVLEVDDEDLQAPEAR
jgi:hypothetical protein